MPGSLAVSVTGDDGGEVDDDDDDDTSSHDQDALRWGSIDIVDDLLIRQHNRIPQRCWAQDCQRRHHREPGREECHDEDGGRRGKGDGVPDCRRRQACRASRTRAEDIGSCSATRVHTSSPRRQAGRCESARQATPS